MVEWGFTDMLNYRKMKPKDWLCQSCVDSGTTDMRDLVVQMGEQNLTSLDQRLARSARAIT